jgi:hypothetical protein
MMNLNPIRAPFVAALVVFSATPALAADGSTDPTCADDCAAHTIEVDCRAVNEFGYVASARGTLRITGRTLPSVLAVDGNLRVDARVYGDSSQRRRVHVQGSMDIFGQFLFADVTSDDALESIALAFVGGTSQLQARDTTQYQTECTHSQVDVPLVTDIVLTHGLRFESLPDGRLRTQIGVSNVGNLPVAGPAARVRIAGRDVSGTLHQTPSSPNAIDAGEQGYIEVDLPANSLTRCGAYRVTLDLDHALQSGAFDPFGNDSGQASSPCLRWDTPISDDALGVSADPLIRGLTLQAIVSSDTVARADGRLCSSCHFPGSGKPYSPPAGTITPTQNIAGRSWSEVAGWGAEFTAQSIKPGYLKQAVQRWLEDGAH